MGEKSFQDNVYGNFDYPKHFEKVIRSKPVQRLFRIKQLGFVEKVYPGGDGNRFSHSLGVMFLMGEFVQKIFEKHFVELAIDMPNKEEKNSFIDATARAIEWTKLFDEQQNVIKSGIKDILDKVKQHTNAEKMERYVKGSLGSLVVVERLHYWKDVAMLCGLFHDLGHGPLSHTFEQLWEERQQQEQGDGTKQEKKGHEWWTVKILSEFYKEQEWSKDGIYDKIQDVISIFCKTYHLERPDGKANTRDQWLDIDRWFSSLICELLSGPFDLDKLDYLMRDSVHLGFGFNKIDYDWLRMNIDYSFDFEKPGDEKHFIFFTEDACTSLEEFIFLRITYYWKCLYHRDVCLFGQLFRKLLNFVQTERIEINERFPALAEYLDLGPAKGREMKVLEYLELDDGYIWEFIKFLYREANDGDDAKVLKEDFQRRIVKGFTDAFLTEENKFKCLYEARGEADIISAEKMDGIRQRLRQSINGDEERMNLFFFWDDAELAGHIVKEGKPIKIRRKQSKLNEEEHKRYFSLLETSRIAHLFVNAERLRRYYVCDTTGDVTDDIRKNILGIEVE